MDREMLIKIKEWFKLLGEGGHILKLVWREEFGRNDEEYLSPWIILNSKEVNSNGRIWYGRSIEGTSLYGIFGTLAPVAHLVNDYSPLIEDFGWVELDDKDLEEEFVW